MNKILSHVLGDAYADFPIAYWPFDGQGMGGDSFVFSEMVNKVKPKVIIEIGSWKGQSAITMADACNKLNLDTAIICVDTWLGSEEHWRTPSCVSDMKMVNGRPTFYNNFIANIIHRGYTDVISPLSLPSADAFYVLKHFGIKSDLTYIDGAHDHDAVYSDLMKYWELRSNTGVIFGHDISWPGVKSAVEAFCIEKKAQYTCTNEFWTII
jgi:hypothetical protein